MRTMESSRSLSILFGIVYFLGLETSNAFSMWEEWNGYRYFFSRKLPELLELPYHNASDYCEQIGGFLTSSTSEEENNFLVLKKEQLYETCWIGLYIHRESLAGCGSCVQCSRERFLPQSHSCDLCNECRSSWQWEDGSAMEWWRWHHAQPDDLSTCARIHGDGKWYDDDCERKLCFICKQSASECVPSLECGDNGFWNCRTKLCTCVSGYWGDHCENAPTTTSPFIEISTEPYITTGITKNSGITMDITTNSHTTTNSITTSEETTIITTEADTIASSTVSVSTSTSSTTESTTATDILNLTVTNERNTQWQVFGLGASEAIILITIAVLVSIIMLLVGILLCLKSRRQLYKDDGSSSSSLLSFIKGSMKSDKSDDQFIDAYNNEEMPHHESFVSDKPQENIASQQENIRIVHSTATPYAITNLCDSLCRCTRCQASRHKPLFKSLTPQSSNYNSATLDGIGRAPKKPPRKFHPRVNYIQSDTTWEDAYYFKKPALAFNSHTQPRPLRLPRYDEMRQQCYTDRSDTSDSIVSIYDIPKHTKKVTTNKKVRGNNSQATLNEHPDETDYFPLDVHPNHRDLSIDSSIVEGLHSAPLKTSTMEHDSPKKNKRKKDKSLRHPRVDALQQGEFDSSGIWFTTY